MRHRVEALVGPVAKKMWVSTFHAACVRILRRDIGALGYPSSFTIYDEADAVRLTGYVLRDLNVDPKRFPPRSRARDDQRREERADPCPRSTRPRHRRSSSAASPTSTASTSRGLQRGRRARLRRPAHAHRAPVQRAPRRARALPRAVRAHPRRRVPGHEPRAERDRAEARSRAPQRLRGGRRGSVDLPLPRRGHPQHPRVRAGVPRRHGDHARAELPVDADDPRRGQRGDREQRRSQAEEPLDRSGHRRSDRALPRRRRGRRGAVGRAPDRAAARRGPSSVGRCRRLLPHERAEPCARGALHARGHPVQGARRHEVLRPP